MFIVPVRTNKLFCLEFLHKILYCRSRFAEHLTIYSNVRFVLIIKTFIFVLNSIKVHLQRNKTLLREHISPCSMSIYLDVGVQKKYLQVQLSRRMEAISISVAFVLVQSAGGKMMTTIVQEQFSRKTSQFVTISQQSVMKSLTLNL